MAHHSPTTNWLLWVNIGPYRKGTTSVCCDTAEGTTAVKRSILFQDFTYIPDTFFGTPYNGYFHKASKKNFKSIRQPNIQLMLQKNLLKKLIIRYHFDSAKCFLTNCSYVVCHIYPSQNLVSNRQQWSTLEQDLISAKI